MLGSLRRCSCVNGKEHGESSVAEMVPRDLPGLALHLLSMRTSVMARLRI